MSQLIQKLLPSYGYAVPDWSTRVRDFALLKQRVCLCKWLVGWSLVMFFVTYSKLLESASSSQHIGTSTTPKLTQSR